TRSLVPADLGRVVEAPVVAHRQDIRRAGGLVNEVEHAFDGVRCPRLDQRASGPPGRVEQRHGPSSSYFEDARRRRPWAEAADRDPDAIVRDPVCPPGRAAGTRLGEYGFALGGTQ